MAWIGPLWRAEKKVHRIPIQYTHVLGIGIYDISRNVAKLEQDIIIYNIKPEKCRLYGVVVVGGATFSWFVVAK